MQTCSQANTVQTYLANTESNPAGARVSEGSSLNKQGKQEENEKVLVEQMGKIVTAT